MKRQRIVFRADGSGTTGYGHFIRSLALASYLKDDYDCHFTTYNSVDHLPTGYQIGEIAKVCDYFPVVGSSLEEANVDFLNKLNPDDIVVLDNYYYTTEYQQAIKDKGCKLVCIDDMHDRHMVCDLLMTACPLKREDFSMESYTRFVGGIEWAFLREPFLKPAARKGQGKIKQVVIALGGADPFHLTDKIIRAAVSVAPDITIDVMAGDTVVISDDPQNKIRIHRRIDAERIVTLFDDADLGIFPASTVCMEAFSRQLPIAAGYYVDNQEEFYKYGIENNLFAALGCLLDGKEVLTARLRNIIEVNRPHSVHMDFKSHRERIIQLFKDLKEN